MEQLGTSCSLVGLLVATRGGWTGGLCEGFLGWICTVPKGGTIGRSWSGRLRLPCIERSVLLGSVVGAGRGCCPLPASEMLCAFTVSLGCLWTSCSLFLQNSEFCQGLLLYSLLLRVFLLRRGALGASGSRKLLSLWCPLDFDFNLQPNTWCISLCLPEESVAVVSQRLVCEKRASSKQATSAWKKNSFCSIQASAPVFCCITEACHNLYCN